MTCNVCGYTTGDQSSIKSCAGCELKVCRDCINKNQEANDLVQTVCCGREVCQTNGCEDQNCVECDAEKCMAYLRGFCEPDYKECERLVCKKCVVKCSGCKNRVCDDHFDNETNLCCECASEETDCDSTEVIYD